VREWTNLAGLDPAEWTSVIGDIERLYPRRDKLVDLRPYRPFFREARLALRRALWAAGFMEVGEIAADDPGAALKAIVAKRKALAGCLPANFDARRRAGMQVSFVGVKSGRIETVSVERLTSGEVPAGVQACVRKVFSGIVLPTQSRSPWMVGRVSLFLD
jgi:hypothetical protein